jgi:type I restriction enzyme, S subunit
MNAERLLAHFERFADAPDAVTRLRRFILDLAVRGKLVPQDANEEAFPVSQAQGKVEIPFALPATWRWVSFGQTHRLIRGVTYKKSESSVTATPGYLPILRANNIGPVLTFDDLVFVTKARISETQMLRPGDFMIALSSGSKNLVGKAALVNQPFEGSFGGFCGVIRVTDPELQSFVGVYLASMLYREAIAAGSRGIGINNLKKEVLSSVPFPLPPLGERRRIVSKVDELIAVCDRLEAARCEREAKRERLTMACFARLNTPDPDPARFADDARFALDILPALTARRDQIQQVRQTILNLAVRGKLVPQEPSDEPASDLLKRLAQDGARYRSERGITVPAPEAIVEAAPFDVPRTWNWVRLGSLFRTIADGDHLPPPRADEGVAFLTIGNVTTGRLDFSNCRQVRNDYFMSLPEYRRPAQGDILYTIVGATFGRAAFVDTARPFCVQRHIAILKPCVEMSTAYLLYLLASPQVYAQAQSSTTGAAQPTIPIRSLRRFVVPLPPLAEQDRIVPRVHELMDLCDGLEASVSTAETTRSRLLDSLLTDALAPVARELHIT